MGRISAIYYFFTPYTDSRERAVGQFFKKLTERSNRPRTQRRLLGLLQQNIAVINLWTEYRYKGYKYLRKSERKKLYANLQLIAQDFERFYEGYGLPADTVVSQIRTLAPGAAVDPEKARLLRALMAYFSSPPGRYKYRTSSSFGRLLRDPARHKLVGDCNQIVTLYIYLYALYYDIGDLQIRGLPEHVALHYNGIDIETTSGKFADYSQRKHSRLLPVEEIVSINLLDTTDAYLSTHEVSAEDFLQSSRLAFILSHNRDIVTGNLQAAYAGLINRFMERNDYKHALKFAIFSRDQALIEVAGHNGAVYELQRKNYAAARRFAKHAAKREQLTNDSWRSEGINHYRAKQYHDAIKAFKHIGERTLIRQCYEALFFEEQSKLDAKRTIESLRRQRGTLKRMRGYAKKSANKQLMKHMDNLYKQLV